MRIHGYNCKWDQSYKTLLSTSGEKDGVSVKIQNLLQHIVKVSDNKIAICKVVSLLKVWMCWLAEYY